MKYTLKLAEEEVADNAEEGSSKIGPYTGMKLVDAASAALTFTLVLYVLKNLQPCYWTAATNELEKSR